MEAALPGYVTKFAPILDKLEDALLSRWVTHFFLPVCFLIISYVFVFRIDCFHQP